MGFIAAKYPRSFANLTAIKFPLIEKEFGHLFLLNIGDWNLGCRGRALGLGQQCIVVDPAAYLSLALVPMPFHRWAWRCHSCRAEWEDDGVGQQEAPC